MIEEQDKISLDAPKGDFGRFITDSQNKRIFFSGKFGTGKTYFLQEFFKDNIDRYDTYHLFPVRYQITNNENIVEFLKYDILVALLEKYPSAFEDNGREKKYSRFALFATFLREGTTVNSFLQSAMEAGEGASALLPDPFLQILSKLGRPLKELLNLDKDFQEFKKKYLSGDKKIVKEFLEEVRQTEDLFATDYLSHLLRTKIRELKGDKKSVLILDDFDRIDPEHIFRILNVLSAHMEGEEDNKFGFDHIILVGDVRNIQSIFYHKYGAGAEFWGYFDKFFTVMPYEFNNDKAVAERIPRLLEKIKYEEPALKNAVSEGGIVKHLLEEVLARALTVGAMNLRQFYKLIKHTFPEVRKGAYIQDSSTDQRNQCIDIGIKLLISLYGSREEFLEILKKIKNASSKSDQDKLPYPLYTNSMLRRMLTLKAGETISWLGKYKVEASQDSESSSSVNIIRTGGVKADAPFFYDVIIEYVTSSKFEKQSPHEYER